MPSETPQSAKHSIPKTSPTPQEPTNSKPVHFSSTPPKSTKPQLAHAKSSAEPSKPHPTPKKSRKQTILYVLFVILWAGLSFLACQFVFAFILRLFLGTFSFPPFWMFIYYVLSYASALALIILVPPKLHKALPTSPTELGIATPPTFVDLGLAPVGYAAYLLLASLLSSIMTLLPWFNPTQSQDIGFSYYLAPADRIFAMLAVVFIAPICEELIMRGWLYGKLRSRLGLVLSVLLTSLVFALLHGQWNISITVFGLSIILCALREITGTIWSGMLLHILSNGIAFYLLYVAQIMI